MYKDFGKIFDKCIKARAVEQNFKGALKTLIGRHKVDTAYYTKSISIVPNINILQNHLGEYFMEINLATENDIYSNLSLDNVDKVIAEVCIQDVSIPITGNLLLSQIGAPYTTFKVRFTFIDTPCEFNFSYDAHLCNTSLYRTFKESYYKLSNILYKDGTASIIKLN